MKVEIAPTHTLLQDVPPEDFPSDVAEFWNSVAYELAQLFYYASKATGEAVVSFAACRKAGSQYIYEFTVSDLSLESTSAINWHGQFTSQWLYAGAIVLERGKVSSHH